MRHEIKTKSTETLVFGDFRYECNSDKLTDSIGNIVHMRRQSADVLAVLAQSRGEIVSKDKLIQLVWKDVVTTDDSLVQCVADIRRVVGREAIKTFPKKGYQLNFEKDKAVLTQKKNVTRRPYWVARITGCTLIAIVLIKTLQPEHNQSSIAQPIRKSEKALAVLPFANLNSNSENQYFSNGLSEDLSTDLSKVSGLTVISHASSFKYPNAESGFKKIADDLGVQYLVRGTVRHENDRIRINVALVDVLNGFNIWADRYDKVQSNPFDVQEEVTREIVAALSLALGMQRAASREVDPDAYYMLLRGLESLRDLTPNGNIEARKYFQRAIELNPQYARAYASVAITHAREIILQPSKTSEATVKKGLEAAVNAIQMNPNIPQAYYALGWLNLSIDEFEHALAAVRHAIKLDTNYSEGYALLAEVALYAGDLNEAYIAIKRAQRLHPHHPPSYQWTEGHILYQQGQFEDAQHVLDKAVSLSPHYYHGQLLLAANLGQLGDIEAAALVFTNEQRKKTLSETLESVSQIPFGLKKRRAALLDGLRKAKINQI